MGFLESIVKRQVRRIVNNAVDEAVDNTIGAALRDVFGQNGKEVPPSYAERRETSASTPSYGESGEKLLRKRLEEVFAQDFPEYEVRTNLDAGVAGARKYSYGLYSNGIAKMMIMVLGDGKHTVGKDVRLAKEASAAYGVPYLNFFAHLPNDMEYVRNRIKENM